MKKNLILLAMFAIVFVSCKKYDVSDPIKIEDLPTMTISGIVYAELDQITPGMNYAPSGTKLFFSIPYDNYKVGAVGNYIVEGTVGSNGTYSVLIPTVSDGVNVTISGNSFIFPVTIEQNVYDSTQFTLNNVSENDCQPGETRTVVLTYDDQGITNGNTIAIGSQTLNITGTLTYVSEVGANPDTSFIPSGTKVHVDVTLEEQNTNRVNTYQQNITVGANGTYQITIPKVENVLAQVDLSSITFLDQDDGSTTHQYVFELNTSIANIYPTDYAGKDFIYQVGDLIY